MSQKTLNPIFQRWITEEHSGSETDTHTWLKNLVRRFYAKMANDSMLMHFFIDRDLDSIADRQTKFLLNGPFGSTLAPPYSGKNPNRAHKNLPPIFSGHFDRRSNLLLELLTQESRIRPEEAQAWIDFERSFRDAILAESKPRTPGSSASAFKKNQLAHLQCDRRNGQSDF